MHLLPGVSNLWKGLALKGLHADPCDREGGKGRNGAGRFEAPPEDAQLDNCNLHGRPCHVRITFYPVPLSPLPPHAWRDFSHAEVGATCSELDPLCFISQYFLADPFDSCSWPFFAELLYCLSAGWCKLPWNPISAILLAVSICIRWTMIGHHTCHGGYNGVVSRFPFDSLSTVDSEASRLLLAQNCRRILTVSCRSEASTAFIAASLPKDLSAVSLTGATGCCPR